MSVALKTEVLAIFQASRLITAKYTITKVATRAKNKPLLWVIALDNSSDLVNRNFIFIETKTGNIK